MSLPSVILGLIIATLYGTAFHFWRGGNGKRLLLFIVLSWAGFLIGHLIGFFRGWQFFDIGSLHLGSATIGSALFLLVGNWLGQQVNG
jgi:hypothetical protein